MKKVKFLIYTLLSLTITVSCIDDDNDELTGNAIKGGLVSLSSTSIGYVVGDDGTYTASGTVFQSRQQTTSVEVYKSFTDAATGNTSNEVLFKTFSIDNTTVGEKPSFSFSFKYEDLREGLTVNDNPLPESDGDLNIGDFWTLKYISTTSEGHVNVNSSATKVSVGTRFAGLYRTINASYYRIGALEAETGSWPAETLIESVDATTYRVVEYFGLFDGNEWYFQIDENDKITYPEKTPSGADQTGNEQPFITCTSHPGEMTNVPCGSETNYVERDDVNGADKLYMSFGYLTDNASGNSREFYQVLEKIVD